MLSALCLCGPLATGRLVASDVRTLSVKQGLRWRRENQALASCWQLWAPLPARPHTAAASGGKSPQPQGLRPVSLLPRRWRPSREHCEQGPFHTLLPQGSAETPQGGRDSRHRGIGKRPFPTPGLPC